MKSLALGWCVFFGYIKITAKLQIWKHFFAHHKCHAINNRMEKTEDDIRKRKEDDVF